MIKGFATINGTKKFANKFSSKANNDFFNKSHNGLFLSSIGIGMYKGEKNIEGDKNWEKSLNYGLLNGINVVDNAIRYRGQRSEKILGRVIKKLFMTKQLSREELFITTKGGLIGTPYYTKDKNYVEDILIKKWKLKRKEIYNNLHCISLNFLKKQFNISRKNLGLNTIDCYFIHNPELAKSYLNEKDFYLQIKKIFVWLEHLRNINYIKNYGIASWNGFRRKKNSRPYINIRKLIKVAYNIAGNNHGLRFIEAPLSIGMPYLHNNTGVEQKIKDKNFVKFLYKNKINFFSSASTYEGKLEALFKLTELANKINIQDSFEEDILPNVSLPMSENSIIQLLSLIFSQASKEKNIFNKLFLKNNKNLNMYPAALNYVRSYPYLTSALCGMNKLKYIKENTILIKTKKVKYKKIFNLLEGLQNINEK